MSKKPPTPREVMPRMEVATVRLHLDTIMRVDKQAIRLGITANKIKREAIEEKLSRLERSAR